jgi:hypothetical protein
VLELHVADQPSLLDIFAAEVFSDVDEFFTSFDRATLFIR